MTAVRPDDTAGERPPMSDHELSRWIDYAKEKKSDPPKGEKADACIRVFADGVPLLVAAVREAEARADEWEAATNTAIENGAHNVEVLHARMAEAEAQRDEAVRALREIDGIAPWCDGDGHRVRRIARDALAAVSGEAPERTCIESTDCENEWHYWRCPKHEDYVRGGTDR